MPRHSHFGAALEARLPSGIFFTLKNLAQGKRPESLPIFPNAHKYDDAGRTPGTIAPHLAGNVSTKASPAHENMGLVGCLPLLDVAVDVKVNDNVSATKLVQTFTNISDHPIEEANYTFPLYNGSAVTSFRCYVGDSRVLVGTVKPKEEAKREYKRAIEKMESAALLEEHTPEVFETLVGNIPPNISVKVEVTYVTELKIEQGGQGVLLTIPTSVAPRYGNSPVAHSLKDSSKGVTELGLRVVVHVHMTDRLKSLECRSHPASFEMGNAGEEEDEEVTSFAALNSPRPEINHFDQRKAVARLSEQHVELGKDFVLLMLTLSDSPKISRALFSATSAGHAALMVTIKPSELFLDSATNEPFVGEIVFLADRSGSMGGGKIKALRDALNVFLKSLPETCTFNMVSFGSSFSSLWKTSKQYSQATLDEAVQHISQFEADMGGTELLLGLRNCVQSRVDRPNGSTQIIALTDGEVWQTEETIEFVRSTRVNLGDKIRFFALGIGHQVSHRLIEGIATAGGGYGEVVGVDNQGKWKERVIGMLNGALSPESWTCEIELGPSFVKQDLANDVFRESRGDHTTGFIQAPAPIPPIHHYSQQSVYCLISPSEKFIPPKAVTVKATAGTLVRTTEILVKESDCSNPALLHLTAKVVLLSLESQASPVSSSTARENAEALGCLYTISSRWTSFVAVDQSSKSTEEISLYKAPISDRQSLLSHSPSFIPYKPFDTPRMNSNSFSNSLCSSSTKATDLGSLNLRNEALSYDIVSVGYSPPFCLADRMSFRASNSPIIRKRPRSSATPGIHHLLGSSIDSASSLACDEMMGDSEVRSTDCPVKVPPFPHGPTKTEEEPSKESRITSSRRRGFLSGFSVASRKLSTLLTSKNTSKKKEPKRAVRHSSDCSEHRFDRGAGIDDTVSWNRPLSTVEGTAAADNEDNNPVATRSLFETSFLKTTGAQSVDKLSAPTLSSLNWDDIVTSQQANGSFQISQTMRDLLNKQYDSGGRERLLQTIQGNLEHNVARLQLLVDTEMMILFIKAKFHQERDLWHLMVQKSEKYMAKAIPSYLSLDFQALLGPPLSSDGDGSQSAA